MLLSELVCHGRAGDTSDPGCESRYQTASSERREDCNSKENGLETTFESTESRCIQASTQLWPDGGSRRKFESKNRFENIRRRREKYRREKDPDRTVGICYSLITTYWRYRSQQSIDAFTSSIAWIPRKSQGLKLTRQIEPLSNQFREDREVQRRRSATQTEKWR